ncbi:transglutaminase superfamily protein [Rhodopseudomonas faecalis]|uniref:Transglutaminase superfamily protein n=1 Tax=Rhodopseudomonas faecalis TaxID=99655 RepID=A0A318TC45_9BRAD|nr:transglutaminase family protein [Rhodopseudomonas faecalis]PYE99921.1 transglutaminase superfamily protein [Rhodopseudomonas faecalis]
MTSETGLGVYLAPAEFVDSDHPQVQRFAAAAIAGADTVQQRLQLLYRAVRDSIRYNPYVDFRSREIFRASSVLQAGNGYCVGKAALFAATCRVIGVPARVGFADVRNHLATPRLLQMMQTNLFAWHGYTECLVEGRWVKASPTFNATLCEKLNVAPLEFDGVQDALMQAFDAGNARFMEYVAQHGAYFDVPAKFLLAEMARQYPHLAASGPTLGSALEDDSAA